MIVEVNTWFLIARRTFNKQGDKPFSPGVPVRKSICLCIISTGFYITWFAIRLIFYPYLLFVIIKEWWLYSARVGTMLNLIAVTPAIQVILIYLNVKWTVDLIWSKCKGREARRGPVTGALGSAHRWR